MTSRRTFLLLLPFAGSASMALGEAAAQTAAKPVDEKEPQAQALGYVTDAKRVDKARFPKYAPPQRCAVCQLYQGQPSAALAPCTLFAGRPVAGPGWCSAYVPKAA